MKPFLLLVLLASTSGARAQKTRAEPIARRNAPGYTIRDELKFISTKPKVAPRHKRAGDFLRVLSNSQGRSAPDGARKTAFSTADVNRLVSFVSRRGLLIADAQENSGRARTLSRVQLKRDLTRTGSSAFDSFAFAGQELRLQSGVPISSRATAKGVVIELPQGLGFTWEREGASRALFLRKLQYLRIDGH